MYLNNTAKDNNQVKGIYFVVPTPRIIKSNQFDPKQQQRYESVINAYFTECEDYKDKIDICFVTVDEFANALEDEFKIYKQHNLNILTHLQKLLTTKKEYNNDYVYLAWFEEKVIDIVVEINFRRTKVWFDLLNLQKSYSLSEEVGEIIKFKNYKHVPNITVFTEKSNLSNVIEDENFLELFTNTGVLKKAPNILYIE